MKQQHTDIRHTIAQLRMKHAVPLLVVACLVQLLLSSQVLAAHPLLVEGLSAFGPVCTVLGLLILLLVSLRFVFGKLTAGGRRLKEMGQRGARRVRTVIFGTEEQRTYASREEVQQVWLYQLHLSQALFRIVSEKTQAACAPLLAEYDGLVRLLRHLGYPELDQKRATLAQVQLSQRDYAFVRQWQTSLYARLYQTQQHIQAQQETVQAALSGVKTLLEAMSLHAAAQDEPGYHRVLGSYELLSSLVQDRRTPPEIVLASAQELQRTMETVCEHLRASQQHMPSALCGKAPCEQGGKNRQGSQQQPSVVATHPASSPLVPRYSPRKRPHTEKLKERPL